MSYESQEKTARQGCHWELAASALPGKHGWASRPWHPADERSQLLGLALYALPAEHVTMLNHDCGESEIQGTWIGPAVLNGLVAVMAGGVSLVLGWLIVAVAGFSKRRPTDVGQC